MKIRNAPDRAVFATPKQPVLWKMYRRCFSVCGAHLLCEGGGSECVCERERERPASLCEGKVTLVRLSEQGAPVCWE